MVHLQVVIPFHQPLNASESELEAACRDGYVPLLAALEAHRGARVTLSFTGHLLDYLSRSHDDLLLQIKRMVKAGQVEVLGGLFYGGAPQLLPELDVRGQIEMLTEFCESFIGEAPAGAWLGELAWCCEAPRLLEETGIQYGFASRTQLEVYQGGTPDLVRIERGGTGLAAFVLDEALSSALPATPPDEWAQALLASAGGTDALRTVWVRAESLGLEPHTPEWCFEKKWLARWLELIGGGHPEIVGVLPHESFVSGRRAAIAKLSLSIAPEIKPCSEHEGAADVLDFPAQFAEVNTLYRRMLRGSDKLREAIAGMEEEGLEEQWSDGLATAQRLVFAAQANEGYWRGPTPGFSDPAVRDAVSERLLKSESKVDALVQGEEDWIATEEEDRDGDLVDEVFVSNRYLTAWIVPAGGGLVRSLDDKRAFRNVLDAGTRRREPFAAAMGEALPADAPAAAPPRRGEDLRRLDSVLPQEVDELERCGIREWLLSPDTCAADMLSGTTAGLPRQEGPIEVLRNGIDEEGDATFHYAIRREISLLGQPLGALLEKEITVPIDAPEIRLRYRVELQDGPGLLAIELPLRLGTAEPRLVINGEEASLTQVEHPGAKTLWLEGGDARVELNLSPALDLWVERLRSVARDLRGYRAVEQGASVVALLRVERSAEATIAIRLGK